MNACQKLIVENLIVKAAEVVGCETAQVNSRSQLTKPCIARGIVYYTAHSQLNLSYRKIASIFDNRNHKGVRYSALGVKEEITVNPVIKDHCQQLAKVINETLKHNVCMSTQY